MGAFSGMSAAIAEPARTQVSTAPATHDRFIVGPCSVPDQHSISIWRRRRVRRTAPASAADRHYHRYEPCTKVPKRSVLPLKGFGGLLVTPGASQPVQVNWPSCVHIAQ